MSQHNKSIVKAFELLEVFEETGQPELNLSVLSQKTGISVSTAFRMVSTLVTLGYLEKSLKDKSYHLGWKFVRMLAQSNSLRERLLISIGEPHVIALGKKYNENASLYVRVQQDRLCIYRVEGTQDVRNIVAVGDKGTLTKGSPGRILLAFMPEEHWSTYFDTSNSSYVEELRRVKAQGYAATVAEYTHGASSISAPIFGCRRELLAALTLSGPTFRMEALPVEQTIDNVKETAKRITDDLISHTGA